MANIFIGLVGTKGSGKDSAGRLIANEFQRTHSCIRISFGAEVKSSLAELTGGDLKTIEKNKNNLLLRRLLQFHGKENLREQLGQTVLIDAARKKVEELLKTSDNKDLFFYFTDVRFLNEASFVKELGGMLFRVERKSLEAEDNHSSETEQVKIICDHTIHNNDGLNRLNFECKIIADWIKQRYKMV